MKVNIYIFNENIVNGKINHDLVPTHLGYVEVEKFDAEAIWHLCNWSCWTKQKPVNLQANIDCCGHGLCLINPKTKERWLAKSVGWLVGDEKTISQYVFAHRNSILWE